MSAFMFCSVASRSPAEQPRTSNEPVELDFTESNSQKPWVSKQHKYRECALDIQRSRVAANCERLFLLILIYSEVASRNLLSKERTAVLCVVNTLQPSVVDQGDANINSETFQSSKLHWLHFLSSRLHNYNSLPAIWLTEIISRTFDVVIRHLKVMLYLNRGPYFSGFSFT